MRGDHALTLPGGRTLTYAVYGDPMGSPILNCHGGLVSGHDVSPADEIAGDLGLCVISRTGRASTGPIGSPATGCCPGCAPMSCPFSITSGSDRSA